MTVSKRSLTRFSLGCSVGFGAICAAIVCLTGCGALMPQEIKVMERESRIGAQALKTERPDAFRNYPAGDRRMHYVEVTDGNSKPMVLFIHGSPGDWSGCVRYLNDPDLRRRANLIAVDRPGFGGSGKGKVERSLVQQCREIAPLLDKAAPGQRVVVVGHSYGGPVVARLAMDYPTKITDVILLAGSVDPDQEHTKWYQYPADWPPFDWLLPDDLVVANREIRALKSELISMLPLWTNVTQSVSFLQGDKDDLVPPENADFAGRMLTHASQVNLVRIPDMNHFIPWSKYDWVKAQLIKHLE